MANSLTIKNPEELKKAIKLSGYSQKEFSEKAGVSPVTINSLLNGRSPSVYPSTARKVSEVLNVEVSFLFGIDDDKELPKLEVVNK